MTSESYCDIQFHFSGKLYGTYYFYNPNGNSSTNLPYEYDKILELIKDDTLAKLLTPVPKIKLFNITTCGVKNKSEVCKIIEYLINNITTPRLEIDIDNIGELNLLQMQPCTELIIFDSEGVLPKEYLHHLVKLLENRRAKIITFRYNKDMPLNEDLAEFENVAVQIDPFVIYAYMTTYVMQLKE